VLQEVKEAAGKDPDIIILNLPTWSALEINALQRASTLVVQKSLQEGFGLTVTEALWKGKTTVTSRIWWYTGTPFISIEPMKGRWTNAQLLGRRQIGGAVKYEKCSLYFLAVGSSRRPVGLVFLCPSVL
jgi:hypothetical protein